MARLRLAVFSAGLLGILAQVPVADPLTRARQLYNEGRFDDAIDSAQEARQIPSLSNAAELVLARAYLERFRKVRAAEDLSAAREALAKVDANTLPGREQVELTVGLGQAVYLDGCVDGCYGAAAELFERALGRADALDPPSRDRVFEWWAGALDRQAQYGPAPERKALYQRILRRCEDELDRNDRSAPATYWLAAAARGAEDYERAWGAAIAGWIRARYMGAAGVTLRGDLDKLVTDVLLRERARQLAPEGDARPAFAALTAQWDDIKKKFGE